jgi:hypothetical protein
MTPIDHAGRTHHHPFHGNALLCPQRGTSSECSYWPWMVPGSAPARRRSWLMPLLMGLQERRKARYCAQVAPAAQTRGLTTSANGRARETLWRISNRAKRPPLATYGRLLERTSSIQAFTRIPIPARDAKIISVPSATPRRRATIPMPRTMSSSNATETKDQNLSLRRVEFPPAPRPALAR